MVEPVRDHDFGLAFEGTCSMCGGKFVLAGYTDFDDLKVGDWIAPGGDDVKFGTASQSNAIYTTTVVSDEDGKYLSFHKSGIAVTGSSNAMAWLVIEKAPATEGDDTIMFESRMRFDKTSGNESCIRFYGDRYAASAGENGSVNIAGNVKMLISSGNVTFGGESLDVARGEWFTLRFVVTSEGNLIAYAKADGGEFKEIITVAPTKEGYTFKDMVSIQFTNMSADLTKFDFDYVYFGGERSYKRFQDLKPEGATDFDDKAEGAFTFDSAAGDSVLVNHYIQSGATATTTIVAAGDNKYFSMDKTAYSLDSSGKAASSQTWTLFERDASATGDEPLVFMTRMRYTATKNNTNYFRFYDGRTAENANNGSVYRGEANKTERNINFRSSGGVVTFNDESLGVAVGEWFTLRLTIDGYTVKAESINDYGEVVATVEVDKSQEWLEGLDLSDCDCIVIMNDSSAILSMDFDWVYFGKVPADKAE